MDNKLDTSNLNTILLKPKSEFKIGSQYELIVRIGQIYVEEKDTYPKILTEKDSLIRFKIKLRDISQGDTVVKNIKALYALIMLSLKLDMKYINFVTELESDTLTIEISFKNEELVPIVNSNKITANIHNGFINLLQIKDLIKGKSNSKIQLGFGPALLFNQTFEEFFDSLMFFSFDLSGDQQLTEFIKLIPLIYLERMANNKNETIEKQIFTPSIEYIKRNIVKQETTKIDYLYDKDFLKTVIDKYNGQWGYEGPTGEFDQFKNNFLNTDKIRDIVGGFFGPYIKTISYLDFDHFEISYWNNIEALYFTAIINIVDANDFLDKNIISLIEK